MNSDESVTERVVEPAPETVASSSASPSGEADGSAASIAAPSIVAKTGIDQSVTDSVPPMKLPKKSEPAAGREPSCGLAAPAESPVAIGTPVGSTRS